MSENFTVPQPTITVESATEADLKEALMGSPTDPTYAEQFGITSAPLGTTGYKPPTMAELELEAQKAMAKVAAEASAIHNANSQPDVFSDDEATHFKKLYGQSENEKGALRKSQQELMEAFNGLMAQYEALQANAGQPAWQPSSPAPQYGRQPFVPQQPMYTSPLANLGDDDVVQGKQIKEILEREIGPAFGALLQQNQEAMARMAQLEGRIVKQTKEASGLTPMDEFRLIGKNPWVRDLAPAARAQALASLRQAELATQAPPPVIAAPTIPAPNDTQQRIVNKMTFVEGSRPSVPDSTEAALEAAKQRDYAKVLAAPAETGERAKLFRLWAHKYGVPIAHPPSDIAH